MKKGLLFIFSILVLLFIPVLTVSAQGESFETAIRLELYKDIIGHKQEYMAADFPNGESVLYFVFTTESDGEHRVYVEGSHSYEVLDSNRNVVSSIYDFEAGATYYIKVTAAAGGNSQMEIMVLDRTLNWSISFDHILIAAGAVVGLLFVIGIIKHIKNPKRYRRSGGGYSSSGSYSRSSSGSSSSSSSSSSSNYHREQSRKNAQRAEQEQRDFYRRRNEEEARRKKAADDARKQADAAKGKFTF